MAVSRSRGAKRRTVAVRDVVCDDDNARISPTRTVAHTMSMRLPPRARAGSYTMPLPFHHQRHLTVHQTQFRCPRCCEITHQLAGLAVPTSPICQDQCTLNSEGPDSLRTAAGSDQCTLNPEGPDCRAPPSGPTRQHQPCQQAPGPPPRILTCDSLRLTRAPRG